MLEAFYHKDAIEAGCDEVGRGCLAGPVCAAAVIFPKDVCIDGLNDSKKLSAQKRETLCSEIIKHALAYAIAFVDHTIIDKINIRNASFLAMTKAVEKLKLTPELLLIDGNAFKSHLFIPYHCVIKGDSKFASIAAASILAKTARDQYMSQMHEKHPHYAWDKNMGYPTQLHRKGLQKHGPCDLHRRSFTLLKPIKPC